jgi:hypothetical protein
MTETEPIQPGPGLRAGALAAGEPLAATLLAAQRLLSRLDVDSEVRIRLHLRYMAICTSLKMPGANRARGSERLERLIADARAACAGRHVGPGNQGANPAADGEMSA